MLYSYCSPIIEIIIYIVTVFLLSIISTYESIEYLRCLLTGKLKSKLADSALGAIVTHALITKSGEYILAAESGNVMYWNVAEKVVIYKEEQKEILQVSI